MTLDALVPFALAGTARRAASAEPLAEPWAHALPADAPERALLLRAGAHAVTALAARRPTAGPAPLPSAPADPRPACAPGPAAYVLALAREAETRPLACEALARMRAHGLRLPHGLLPEALDVGDREARAALRPVLGARGAWLAGFRADWAWGAEADLSAADVAGLRAAWDEGAPAARLAAFATLRARDPAAARDWLAEAAGDKPEHRARLLEALADGLGPADEPLLERYLADRAAGVRAQAARLLARLPGSALAGRMATRADAVVAGDLATGLTLAPPEELPADWAADGIEAKPPEGVGPRAWWLAQLLARIPLARWTTRFSGPPAAIAAAFAAGEWGVMALEGLARAALDAADADWIEALHAAVEPFATAKGRGDPLRFRAQSVFQALAPALPPARRAMRILAELRGDAPSAQVFYVADLPTPWPADLAAGVLEGFARHVATTVGAKGYKPFHDPWIGVLHAAALGLPPEAEAALPDLPTPRPDALTYLGNALDRLRQHLAIRRRLAEELAP